MKNILFIVSHHCSGSGHLIDILNENERIDIKRLSLNYTDPSILEYIFKAGHKLDNAAAIYGDQVLTNPEFSSKIFYEFAKFIYVVRSAKLTLNEIMFNMPEFDVLRASRHYCFRLRRIYEMARNTPKAVLLTADNIAAGQGLDLIQNYLSLATPLVYREPITAELPDMNIPYGIIKEAQDCYEKYLYNFKNLSSLATYQV